MGKKTVLVIIIFLLLCAGLYTGIQLFTKSRIKKEISGVASELSALENLQYEILDVGPVGSWICLNKVTMKLRGINETLRIGRIRIREYRLEKNQLSALNLELSEIRIPSVYYFSNFFPMESTSQSGSHRVTADMSLIYQYDPSSRRVNVENLKITFPDLASASANIQLENIDPSKISLDNPEASIPSLISVSLAAADLAYQDHSAFRRIFRQADGSPTPALQAAMRAISDEMRRIDQEGGSKKTKGELEKIWQFLQAPEKIRISAYPSSPIPLARLLWIRKPGEIIEAFNIKVEL